MAGLKLACLSCGQGNRVAPGKPARQAKCGICGDALFRDRPIEIDPRILSKAAKLDDVPLIVDFWAPWCGPCRMMAPEFAKAAQQLSGVARFAKLNTQDFPNAGQHYGIRGIPALIGFRAGGEKARRAGAIPAQEIVKFAQGVM